YGTGSDLQKAAQAVTGALTALAGNNLAGALASGASPYLATEIKKRVGEENIAANAMAHAVLGAVTAQLNNQSAAAGGLGAGGGELTARYIAGQLFPGKTAEQLSESEKQQVSALSQLAAGLAGGLATGDTAGAVTGGQAGKNAVENNSLSGDKARESVKQAAESLKNQVREKLGEGTTSAIANAIINGLADTGDAALGSADYAADAAMALASCAAGDSYCSKAMSDLAGKNQAVADTVTALMQSETWSAVKDTLVQASEGNQAALEATGGLIAGIILPGKKVPHTPNAGAVGNMSEFLKQPGFGSEIKELSKKTSKQYQGQSVYQANKPVGNYIQKGDQFYLDAKHKDHIEVFDSTGTKVRAVLNLDGSFNDAKTKAAKAEGRRLPK
ncbi:VENN motif pre-toxin domain-containing protein, partial [Serratia montpellierensis]